MISIIIRTRNEERWIGRCLRMVFQQKMDDFEVIIVDNQSSDNTLQIVQKFPVKIVNIDSYMPGKAINMGVRASVGRYIVCLSAHCIPQDEMWLQNLYRNMEDENIAGVYGRQLPFTYSSDLDKRDLFITFGLDRRIQVKDSFFHNANSMVRRNVWEKIPFDENATNIEDRIWGKAVIEAGYGLAYEPEAAVYHHHGIHQDRNEERVKNVVKIMESLGDLHEHKSMPYGFAPDSMNIVAILPVLGSPLFLNNHNLLERCIEQVKQTKYLNKIVVISENTEVHNIAKKCGISVINRPKSLEESHVTVEEVLRYALRESERGNHHYDAVLYVNYLYPFRPKNYFDRMIEEFALSGVDSLIPTLKDYQPHWMQFEDKLIPYDKGFLPRELKMPMQKGMPGLGCISCSEFIRNGRILGDNIALIPFDEHLYSMKAKDAFDKAIISLALEKGVEFFGIQNGAWIDERKNDNSRC